MSPLSRMRAPLQSFKGQIIFLAGMLLFLWLEELLDQVLFHGALDSLGVRPRDPTHWYGVLLAPFLHGGFAHLAANSIPLGFLGWLILLRGWRPFLAVTAFVWLTSGVGAWFFGAPGTIHIGASGIVFGYFGFLLMRAVFERSLAAMSSALIVVMLYGSLIWGVLPLIQGISWQMHLFGLVGGGAAARWLARPAAEEDVDVDVEEEIGINFPDDDDFDIIFPDEEDDSWSW